MITEYLKENGKIIAIDNKKGLKKYDYQDNIEDILKQENIVEELQDTINKLKKEKDLINDTKKSYLNMIRTENYGDKVLALFLASSMFLVVMQLLFIEYPISVVFKNIGAFFMFSIFPFSMYEYKKYKNDMNLKLANIKEQISEFEDILDEEQMKLYNLKKEYKKENIDKMTNSTFHIDNRKNEKLIEVENKKQLYQTYRKYCSRILKSIEKNKLSTLFDNTYNDQDIENIKGMSDRASKVLSKKYNANNK